MEDVVLRLHFYMAGLSTVSRTRIGGELISFRCVVEQSVSPPARFRKSLRVFFHEESLRKGIRHIHHERRLGALLRLPLQLGDLRAFRERLAVAGNTRLVRID